LICSEELGNRHQTPTLIGCMLLRNLQELSAAFSSPPSFLAVFAAISEALDYDRFFRVPSNFFAASFAIRAFASSRCRHQRSLRFYTDF
jgi:hypothetical protein